MTLVGKRFDSKWLVVEGQVSLAATCHWTVSAAADCEACGGGGDSLYDGFWLRLYTKVLFEVTGV